jgi:hypothetical protein
MRVLYGLLAIAALILFVWWWQMPVPEDPDVSRRILEHWYRSAMLMAAVCGVIWGVLFVHLAKRLLRHEPRQQATVYLEGVARQGCWAAFWVLLLVVVLGAYMAIARDLGPFSVRHKLALVLPTMRFGAVLAVGAFATLAAYAVMSRVLNWGGRYAVVGFVPKHGS